MVKLAQESVTQPQTENDQEVMQVKGLEQSQREEPKPRTG